MFCFVFLIESKYVKMSRIQIPYGEVIDKNRETVKLDLPKNYRASEYFKLLLYLHEFSNFYQRRH